MMPHETKRQFFVSASVPSVMGDPEVLAEAAAAASRGLDAALRAGGEIARDGPMEGAERGIPA
jgi:hypothetical protein